MLCKVNLAGMNSIRRLNGDNHMLLGRFSLKNKEPHNCKFTTKFEKEELETVL